MFCFSHIASSRVIQLVYFIDLSLYMCFPACVYVGGLVVEKVCVMGVREPADVPCVVVVVRVDFH